jgi:hypothetical protein
MKGKVNPAGKPLGTVSPEENQRGMEGEKHDGEPKNGFRLMVNS